MDPRDTGTMVPSSICKAVERRACIRRANLRRREGLVRFAVIFRELATIMGREAGKIPANGDTLVKLEDANKGEIVECIKDKHCDEDFDLFQKIEELQLEFVDWVLEASEGSVEV